MAPAAVLALGAARLRQIDAKPGQEPRTAGRDFTAAVGQHDVSAAQQHVAQRDAEAPGDVVVAHPRLAQRGLDAMLRRPVAGGHGRHRHQALDGVGHLRRPQAIVVTAALLLHHQQLAGDEPGEVAARGGRGHPREVGELLRGQRAAGERAVRMRVRAGSPRSPATVESMSVSPMPTTLERAPVRGKPQRFGLDRSVPRGRSRLASPYSSKEDNMITLCIRYTLDAAKVADFTTYAQGVAGPIERCGGKVVGYFAPTSSPDPPTSGFRSSSSRVSGPTSATARRSRPTPSTPRWRAASGNRGAVEDRSFVQRGS